MPVLNKGTFSLNLGIIQLGAELGEEDRQCAWELYTELSTRVAVTGKQRDQNCTDFSGELYIESLSSLYNFFQEARSIMRAFPVGKIAGNNQNHLGIMINRMMDDVLRPFLEKWQVKYRHWWEDESNPKLPPIERQKQFPEIEAFLADWSFVRWLMRSVQQELVNVYQLVNAGGHQ
jgi:hypothetical protein